MAKAKTKTEKPTKTLAANRKKRRARPRAVAVRSNPSSDASSTITQVVLPAFAAYAGTRVVSRVVFSLVSKRWPKWAKHASALAGIATFAGAYFFAHRVKQIAKFNDGIIVGTGVGALHGVAATYLPAKYAWLIRDASAADAIAPQAKVDAQLAAAVARAAEPTAGYHGINDEFSQMEAELDAMAPPEQRRRARAQQRASAAPTMTQDMDDGDDGATDPDLDAVLNDGEDVEDLFGAFGN